MSSNPKIHDAEVIRDNKTLVKEDTLPAVVPSRAFNLVPLDQLEGMCKAIDEAKRKVMIENRDYMTIPGCTKPSLLKPGGEKLMKLFNLSPRFFEIKVIEEHHREYTHKVQVWENNRKVYGKFKDVEVKGWYFYRIRCELFDKTTGQSWGDGIGICSSNERPGQPANTISKMAQKSAMLAAVLIVCNASDLFSQDMDDPPSFEPGPNSPNGDKSKTQLSGDIEREMKSRYGSEDNPNKCKFCGNNHIVEGDRIVLANGLWGVEECFRMQKLDDDAREKAKEERMAETTGGDGGDDLPF